jgi:hypothetical protein
LLLNLCSSSNTESTKRKAILMVPSSLPGDDDDISVHPSTVTRFYQPTPYNSSCITQSGTLPPSGDLDPYCSPHYGYQHVASPAGNYMTTYCRSPTVDLCASCTPHVTGSKRLADTDVESDTNVGVNPTSGGLSTILTSMSGSAADEKIYEIGGQFYQSGLHPNDTTLFPVRVPSGTGSGIARTAADVNCVESYLARHSTSQLLSH